MLRQPDFTDHTGTEDNEDCNRVPLSRSYQAVIGNSLQSRLTNPREDWSKSDQEAVGAVLEICLNALSEKEQIADQVVEVLAMSKEGQLCTNTSCAHCEDTSEEEEAGIQFDNEPIILSIQQPAKVYGTIDLAGNCKLDSGLTFEEKEEEEPTLSEASISELADELDRRVNGDA